jgi:hypothetical protein
MCPLQALGRRHAVGYSIDSRVSALARVHHRDTPDLDVDLQLEQGLGRFELTACQSGAA